MLMYTYMHIYIYTCTYIHKYIYTQIHTYICTRIPIHTYTRIYTYMHIYICTYIHIYMYTYTYIFMYMFTYMKHRIHTLGFATFDCAAGFHGLAWHLLEICLLSSWETLANGSLVNSRCQPNIEYRRRKSKIN